MNARVMFKRDTLDAWSTRNPVLLEGEIAVVSTADGARLKVGDGKTAFKSLPYIDDAVRKELEGKLTIPTGNAGDILCMATKSTVGTISKQQLANDLLALMPNGDEVQY